MKEFEIDDRMLNRMKIDPMLTGSRIRKHGVTAGTFHTLKFFDTLPMEARKTLADRASNTGRTITEIMQDDLRNLYNVADEDSWR